MRVFRRESSLVVSGILDEIITAITVIMRRDVAGWVFPKRRVLFRIIFIDV